MAVWQQILPIMVRHLANDTDSSKFSNDRIEEAIVVSALIVAQEYDFSQTYTFDLDGPDISPDPVTTNDQIAIALISLKAACMLQMNQFADAPDQCIRVKDGDSSVDTSGGLSAWEKIVQTGPCKTYKELLKRKQYLKSMMSGKAIMNAFSHEDFAAAGSLMNTQHFFNSVFAPFAMSNGSFWSI